MMGAVYAWLGASLGVSKLRGRSVLRAACFHLLFVAGVTFFKAATNAMVLDTYGPRILPYLYLGTALAVSLVTFALSRRLGTVSARVLLRGALLGAAVGVTVLSAACLAPRPWGLGPLYVAGEVYATTLSVLFWARLGEVFHVREAKRVFGWIGAAGMLGATIGGVLVGRLAPHVPALSWCFAGAGTLLLCRPLLGRGGHRARRAGDAGRRSSLRAAATVVAEQALPRRVGILVLLLAAQNAVVDYWFRSAASVDVVGPEAMVRLFGHLNVVVGVGALLAQLGLTTTILRKLGVFSFLSMIPLVLLGAALVGTASAPLALVFLVKAVETMGAISLNQPAIQLLYGPLAHETRDALRALLDGALKKLGAAMGAVGLLVLGPSLGARAMPWVVAAIALGLLLWLRPLRRGYLSALRNKLHEDSAGPTGDIELRDRDSVAFVLAGLEAEDPGRIVASLEVLLRAQSPQTIPAVRLLLHPNRRVRAAARDYVLSFPEVVSREALMSALWGPDNGPRAELARVVLARTPQTAMERMRSFISAQTEDTELLCVATEAMLPAAARDQAAAGLIDLARVELRKRAFDAPQPARAAIAELLGKLPGAPEEEWLVAYLDDSSPAVRRAAVSSLAEQQATGVVPGLLRRLAASGAVESDDVAAFGDGAVPYLASLLNDRSALVAVRRRVPAILRRIGTQRAAEALLASNARDDAYLRYVTIRAGSRLLREHPEVKLNIRQLEESALRRLRAYRHYLPIERDLRRGGPPYSLLARAVRSRVRQNLEASLLILGMGYDYEAMQDALAGLLSRDERKFADGTELLDVALTGRRIRRRVLSWLEFARGQTGFVSAEARAETLAKGRDRMLALVARETLRRTGAAEPALAELEGEQVMQNEIVDRVFALEAVQLFHGLAVDDLAAVAELTEPSHIGPGEVIYREGEPGRSMYVIVSGDVRLIRGGDPLMELGSGDSFGQVSILDGGPRPVTAISGPEGTDVLKLERQPFLDLMVDRPGITQGLFTVLARRLRELVDLTGSAMGGRAAPSAPGA